MPSVTLLRAKSFDVRAIGEESSGVSDEAVLSLAVSEQRWIITFDRDYGELLYARRLPPPPAVIFLRLMHYRPEDPGHLIASVLSTDHELQGHFVVLNQDGFRKRKLPRGL